MLDYLNFLTQSTTTQQTANDQLQQGCVRGTAANTLLKTLQEKAHYASQHIAFDPLEIRTIPSHQISKNEAGWIDTKQYTSKQLQQATLHYFAFLPLRENDYQTIAWVISVVSTKDNKTVLAIEAEKRYSGLLFKQRKQPFLAHLFLSPMEANKALNSYLVNTQTAKEQVLQILTSGGEQYEQTNHKNDEQEERFSYRQQIAPKHQALIDYFGYREPLMLFLSFDASGSYLRGNFE